MKRFLVLVLMLGGLTACGADGPPIPPEPEPDPIQVGGVTITGTVGVGVKGRL